MDNNALRRRPKPTQGPVSEAPAETSDRGPSIEQLCGAAGFLVLTRKRGEDIVIEVDGLLILIKQLDIQGGRSRLGIMASKRATIHRREVFEAIRRGE